jgi:hypothetical protein
MFGMLEICCIVEDISKETPSMSNSNLRQAGFGAVGIVAVVVVLFVVAGTGFVVLKKSGDTKTAVTPAASPSATPSNTAGTGEPVQPVDDSKLYANEKYGLSFAYPKEWRVEERDPNITYIEPVELSLAIVDTLSEKDSIVATVAVSSSPLSEVGPVGDGEKASPYKKQVVIKSKQAVQYSIPQTESVNREMYYIAAGGKTYWVHTFDEENNAKRDKDYTAKFNKIVESLKLP